MFLRFLCCLIALTSCLAIAKNDEQDKALIRAVKNGDYEAVKSAIRSGANILVMAEMSEKDWIVEVRRTNGDFLMSISYYKDRICKGDQTLLEYARWKARRLKGMIQEGLILDSRYWDAIPILRKQQEIFCDIADLLEAVALVLTKELSEAIESKNFDKTVELLSRGASITKRTRDRLPEPSRTNCILKQLPEAIALMKVAPDTVTDFVSDDQPPAVVRLSDTNGITTTRVEKTQLDGLLTIGGLGFRSDN